MPHFANQPASCRYGFAVLAVAFAAIAVHYVPIVKETGHGEWVAFFFAVVITVFCCGSKPGLLAVSLSLVGLNALVLPSDWIAHPLWAIILNLGFGILSGIIIAISRSQQKLINALKESQHDLNLAQAVGKIGSWRFNNQSNEAHWSAETYHIFGIPEDTVVTYQMFLAAVHPEDIGYVNEKGDAALKGQLYDVKHRIIVEGEVKWIHEKAIFELSNDGTLLGGFGIAQDITKRKQAEIALQEQENQLRLIMNLTPALIAYLDTDFRYVRANKAYEDWYGITMNDIIGHTVREIVKEDIWKFAGPHLQQALSGKTCSYENQLSFPNLGFRWIKATFVPDTDASGTVKGIVVHVADIDERKQAEQKIALLNIELLNKIEEMQAIFDTAPIGLCITNDTEAKQIRGNPAMRQILGLPNQSELSLSNPSPPPVRAFIDGYEPLAEELPMQRAVRGETVIDQILELHRPDSQVVTLLCNTKPLLGKNDLTCGAVGAFLDVTKFRAAELALNESKERLRLAQEAGALGIFDHDLISGEMQWDGRLRKLWGVKPDKPLFTEAFMAGVHPDDRTLVKAAVKRSFDPQGNGEYKAEYRIIRPTDNRTFWIAACGRTTFANGKPIRLVGYAQDVTERKLAETKLRDTETRLSLALAELKAGYWDWDLIKNEVYFSPVWKQQLGFNDNEIPNQYEEWENRLHPDDKAQALESVENYLNGRSPSYEVEFRLLHKDGTYRWIHSRAALVREQDNNPVRLLGIHLDITDFKGAKDLNQKRKTMEETSRLHIASQTAAAIAHDLNQPLTAATYYADAAVKMLQNGNADPEQLSQALTTCSQQVHRAGKVVPQLLRLLYRDETSIEVFNINDLLNDVRQLIDVEKVFAMFKLTLNLDYDLPSVSANPLQIQKILVNLINNGFEAMLDSGKRSGTLTVTVHGSADNPNMVEINVCDEGVGVSDDSQLKQIFQPFYTTKKSGLGMGLPICRSLIQAYGGEIWAEKNADAGISVNFTLPLCDG